MNSNENLCNETRLIVSRLRNHGIEAEALGDEVLIPSIVLAPSESRFPFFSRRSMAHKVYTKVRIYLYNLYF